MKPYSKKYLTLALAGILAASVPMTTFAKISTDSEESANIEIRDRFEKLKNQNETDRELAERLEEIRKDEAKKEAERKEEARKESKNYPSDIYITTGIEDTITDRDILRRLPDGARILSWDNEKFYNSGRRTRTAYVEFKDGTTKNITVNIDVANRYNDYRDIDLRNVYYDGKKITGRTVAGADIYIESNGYNDKYIGRADRDGYFSINYTINKNESIKIYAKDGNRKSSSVRIYGTTDNKIGKLVEAQSLNLFGRNLTGFIKDHPFENIRVYLNGNLLGSFRTDKNSYFSTTISENIRTFDIDNLRFYKDEKEKSSDKFVEVNEAKAGTRVVKGKSRYKDTVIVYDAKNNELGRAAVPVSAFFTVNLNRELVAGEKITVETRDDDNNFKKVDYTVTGRPQVEVKSQIAYIKGYPDGTFRPQNNVTRAEAAQMFGVLLNEGPNFGTSTTTRFTDANGQWYSKAVNYVVAKGLINGYPNGEFKPNDSITRAEFAQMISGYIKNNEAKSTFTDVQNHWARQAIDKLYANKHINGYPDGTFKPDDKITRAEAVTILNSVFNRVTNQDTVKDLDESKLNKFSDVDKDFWGYYNILDASNSIKTSK